MLVGAFLFFGSYTDNQQLLMLFSSTSIFSSSLFVIVYEPKNKKAPVSAGTQNKNNFNSSICQNKGLNTEKIKFVNNF